MARNIGTITPDFSDAVRAIVDTMLMDLHVGFPAKVVSYDPSTQYADVEIQLMMGYVNGTSRKYPVIPNVPVKHPRAMGGAARIHMPIQAGDDVTLMFSSRSLDLWKSQGGMTDPQDARKSHVTDAFALIGGSAMPDAFEVQDPQSIEMVNGSGMVQIKPDGTVNVNTFVQVKPDGTVNLGSFSPSHDAALADEVENRLEALENGLSTLVTEMQTFITEYDAHAHDIILPVPSTPTTNPLAPGTPPDPFVPDTSVIGSTKVKVIT